MSMDGFTWEGVNNAWNYLGRLFDLGSRGCVAAVVSQPAVGLCPDWRRKSRSPRRCHSHSCRPYLDFAPVVQSRCCAGEAPLVPVMALEVA